MRTDLPRGAFCTVGFRDSLLRWGVAKSIKALNHEVHEGHKGKEKLFLVLFVFFVVPFFSETFATPTFEVIPTVAMAW